LAFSWLSHGPRVRADIFVACLGVQPNSFLAERAGLEVGRGIRVDAVMRTSDPDIFAAGDVAEGGRGSGGLWPIGSAQAGVAAAAIFGAAKSFEPPRIVLQLKCDGIDLRSFGAPFPEPGDEVFTSAPKDIAYWRIVLRRGEAAGAVYVGPPGSSKHFTRVIQSGLDLTRVREQLIAGSIEGLKSL
jgi:NAD(P)H-nitrite reductase large subunit